MAHKRRQNDENEDPQQEVGVEVLGVQKKSRRGGNNTSKRATRRTSTAQDKDGGNVGGNGGEGQGSAHSLPTKSVLEELGTQSHEGDSNISDDDDDPVELQRNNGRPPSRGPTIVGGRGGGQVENGNVGHENIVANGRPPSRGPPIVGGHVGNGNVGHVNVVNNGRPPSRDYPFVGGSRRGSQLGNTNIGARNVANNGEPPSRDYPFVGGGHGSQLGNTNVGTRNVGEPPSRDYPFVETVSGGQLGNGNVATGNAVHNGGPPTRDNPLVGGGRGGQQGTENRNSNAFRGTQGDGQRLGPGNAYTVGGTDGFNGLHREWTDELQGGGVIEHGMTSLQQHERRAVSYRTAKGLTKKNIRERIQVTLKTVIFRGVKFITCKEYFDMVMQVILDQEQPADTHQFVRMYKTIVMGALNTKRST